MKKLRMFKCKSGVTVERLVVDDVTSVKCDCGEQATKAITSTRYFQNTTGKSPSASCLKQ